MSLSHKQIQIYQECCAIVEDLLPNVMLSVGGVLLEGAEKHDTDGIKRPDIAHHLRHGITHAQDALAEKDDQKRYEELTHAASRLCLALQIFINKQVAKENEKEQSL